MDTFHFDLAITGPRCLRVDRNDLALRLLHHVRVTAYLLQDWPGLGTTDRLLSPAITSVNSLARRDIQNSSVLFRHWYVPR